MELVSEVGYFIATGLLILGLQRMSSPRTARGGIVWAGIGMLLAVVVTFGYPAHSYSLHPESVVGLADWRLGLIVGALALGGIPAWWSGRRVPITEMPQMVAIYNGLGGGAAATIAAVEMYSGHAYLTGLTLPIIAVTGAMVGSIAFGGSIVAFLKLQGWMMSPRFPGRRAVNLILTLAVLALAVCSIFPSSASPFIRMPVIWIQTIFFIVAVALGVLITLPIGGADMPVVISTYNASIGLAVGFEGFVVHNPAMIIAGTVVGAAGGLLTYLMATAMNRSFGEIWLSEFGDVALATGEGAPRTMQSMEPSDAAATMAYSESVIVVPGYGLAVAQAQHKLWDLVQLLQNKGVRVRFAVHPVAGRMPGHMSVLLAEAGVPYDLISDLEEINGDFPTTDVALVIGANDVVNPAARTDKTSPIYGMPILNADQARQVFVIKRGRGTGFSGVENELFFGPNTRMVFGDARSVINQMIQSLREL